MNDNQLKSNYWTHGSYFTSASAEREGLGQIIASLSMTEALLPHMRKVRVV